MTEENEYVSTSESREQTRLRLLREKLLQIKKILHSIRSRASFYWVHEDPQDLKFALASDYRLLLRLFTEALALGEPGDEAFTIALKDALTPTAMFITSAQILADTCNEDSIRLMLDYAAIAIEDLKKAINTIPADSLESEKP